MLQLWAEWMMPGDCAHDELECININTPFFDTSMMGGFKAYEFSTRTLPGIDGAFALLLSHICCTDLSVGLLKKQLNVSRNKLCLLNVSWISLCIVWDTGNASYFFYWVGIKGS
jgi:hypothetical protein